MLYAPQVGWVVGTETEKEETEGDRSRDTYRRSKTAALCSICLFVQQQQEFAWDVCVSPPSQANACSLPAGEEARGSLGSSRDRDRDRDRVLLRDRLEAAAAAPHMHPLWEQQKCGGVWSPAAALGEVVLLAAAARRDVLAAAAQGRLQQQQQQAKAAAAAATAAAAAAP